MSENATARLRELLDERGVKWEDDTPVPSMKPWKTSFTSFTGEEVSIGCYDEQKLIMGTLVFHTPEQAIEATLGGGDVREMVNEELLSLCNHMLRLLEEKCDEPHEQHHGKPCETCAEDCSLDCPKVLRERLQHISGAKVVDE